MREEVTGQQLGTLKVFINIFPPVGAHKMERPKKACIWTEQMCSYNSAREVAEELVRINSIKQLHVECEWTVREVWMQN